MDKKPPKRKNVSQTIPNGTFILTNDKYLFGADGKSTKTRMATAVDSNRDNELAIVKYTTSQKHGKSFKNNKGFISHGDNIITKTVDGKPIIIDGKQFVQGSSRRNITEAQANEIKKNNLKKSRYKRANRNRLRELKKRK